MQERKVRSLSDPWANRPSIYENKHEWILEHWI